MPLIKSNIYTTEPIRAMLTVMDWTQMNGDCYCCAGGVELDGALHRLPAAESGSAAVKQVVWRVTDRGKRVLMYLP